MIEGLKIIRDTADFFLEEETAAAIGKFDGIHLGHRKIIEEICKKKRDGLQTCIFTFDPAPAVYFGGCDGKELTTREEKRELFEQLGIDILIEFPMNAQTAATNPVTFAREILCRQMKVRFLAAGPDLSFGDKGAGNIALLQQLAPSLHFELKTVEKVRLHDEIVSSTLVRKEVEQGNLERARSFLGMPYMIAGKVVKGNQIGRTLGFPTLNVIPAERKLLPPNGVYYSEVLLDGVSYRAISNVGTRPTIGDNLGYSVETYLYDFSQDAYGKEIRVYLYEFKRSERQFDGLEELKRQLDEDIRAGSVYQKQK